MRLINAKTIVYLFAAMGLLFNFVFAQTSLQTSVLSALCGIVGFVRTIIGVLAIVLFILGGVIYAVGHFLPATGGLRQNMQGWAMGMLFAGIVAIIIFIIAQPLVTAITGLGAVAGASSVSIAC
ncbi:MAG: hypothetical protein QXT43_00730 [Candidatus Micrarchaeaceae archaeon]